MPYILNRIESHCGTGKLTKAPTRNERSLIIVDHPLYPLPLAACTIPPPCPHTCVVLLQDSTVIVPQKKKKTQKAATVSVGTTRPTTTTPGVQEGTAIAFCNSDQIIAIKAGAKWAATSKTGCNIYDVTSKLQALCDGTSTCTIPVQRSVLDTQGSTNNCPLEAKTLTFDYTCVDMNDVPGSSSG